MSVQTSNCNRAQVCFVMLEEKECTQQDVSYSKHNTQHRGCSDLTAHNQNKLLLSFKTSKVEVYYSS